MFPLEIWWLVAEHTEPHTILSLRLVSKALHIVCEPTFERVWIHERVHKVTPEGLQTLNRSTKNTKLASLIDTVILDRERRIWLNDGFEEGLLRSAFRNLARQNRSISLGLRRPTIINHDVFSPAFNDGITDVAVFMKFSKIASIADMANLKVKSLILDPQHTEIAQSLTYFWECSRPNNRLIPTSVKESDLTIRFYTQGQERVDKPYIHWCRADNRVDIEGVTRQQLQVAKVWLQKLAPSSVSFINCDVETSFIQTVASSALLRVVISNVKIFESEEVSWTDVVQTIRHIHTLEFCHLNKLMNSLGQPLLGGGTKAITAHGSDDITEQLGFILAPTVREDRSVVEHSSDEGA